MKSVNVLYIFYLEKTPDFYSRDSGPMVLHNAYHYILAYALKFT